MAKNRAGLPEGFELDLSSPASLGDYLDEETSGNAIRAIVAKRKVEPQPSVEKISAPTPPPAPAVHVMPEQRPIQPLPKAESVLDLSEARKRATQREAFSSRPERVQCNMRPDTLKMLDEILEFVRRYSLQPDTKNSEIFDAMIGILHDAKKEMAFNDVPRRGQWGTPTARAFTTALGMAFAKAISSRFRKITEDGEI